MKTSRFTFFKQVWIHLIRPYWTSEDKWKAFAFLGGHVLFLGFYIAISVRINYWNNDFFTALQELNGGIFLASLAFSAS